jgi:hypothetical protein
MGHPADLSTPRSKKRQGESGQNVGIALLIYPGSEQVRGANNEDGEQGEIHGGQHGVAFRAALQAA